MLYRKGRVSIQRTQQIIPKNKKLMEVTLIITKRLIYHFLPSLPPPLFFSPLNIHTQYMNIINANYFNKIPQNAKEAHADLPQNQQMQQAFLLWNAF